MGHANIAVTLDTYSHVIPALQESAAELVAALIDGEACESGVQMEYKSQRQA